MKKINVILHPQSDDDFTMYNLVDTGNENIEGVCFDLYFNTLIIVGEDIVSKFDDLMNYFRMMKVPVILSDWGGKNSIGIDIKYFNIKEQI